MTPQATVFVVDDNPAVRRSMRALAESAGLAAETYASAREFLDAYDSTRPGCLVLDLRLGGSSGLDLQEELVRRKVPLPVIVVTAYGNVKTSVRAFKGGAIDFLQKPVSPRKLLLSIHEAIERDRRTRAVEAARFDVGRRIAHLTPREREVMESLVLGKSTKAIAVDLALSARTVEGHRRAILRKMEVSSALELVHLVLAKQSGA